jgi:hypothetical protein
MATKKKNSDTEPRKHEVPLNPGSAEDLERTRPYILKPEAARTVTVTFPGQTQAALFVYVSAFQCSEKNGP